MIKVLCKINDLEQLPLGPARSRIEKLIRIEGPIDPLMIGTIYPVCAVSRWDDGGTWVYIFENSESDWPTPLPAEFFEFVETSIPEGWLVTFSQGENGTAIETICFPEWIQEEHFYERLLDGDSAAANIFERWKVKLLGSL
ncbi:MAG: hypothetical protein Q7T44_06135 [Parvibaculum sp.]|nr:hypothetical protein [Parvibaculum sp.]